MRPTAFEKAGSSGSAAPVEALALDTPVEKSALSSFLGASVTKSERPDLTSARGTRVVCACVWMACFALLV